jgi:hypothetical protein
MTNLERLRKMRELLTPEGAWTQDTYGLERNEFGDLVDWIELPNRLQSCECFCIAGAWFATTDFRPEFGHESVNAVFADLIPIRSVSAWNDDRSRTHTEVLDLIDRAILREGAQNG